MESSVFRPHDHLLKTSNTSFHLQRQDGCHVASSSNNPERLGAGYSDRISDSLSALQALHNQSSNRTDIVYEILCLINKVYKEKEEIKFLWVPSHVGIQGKEEAVI